MIKMKRGFLGIAVVAVIFGIFAANNIYTVLKFQKNYSSKGFANLNMAAKYIPECCNLPEIPNQIFKNIKQFRNIADLPDDKALIELKKYPVQDCMPLLKKLFKNFKLQYKKSSFNEKIPNRIDYTTAMPDFAHSRTVAHSISQVVRYYALVGNNNAAIKGTLGMFSIAPAMLDSKYKNYSFIPYMVSFAILNMASKTLISTAHVLKLNKKNVIYISQGITKLMSQFPTLGVSLQYERNQDISYSYELQASRIKKEGKDNPAKVLKEIRYYQNQILSEIYDPYFKFADMSWKKGHEKIAEMDKKLIDFVSVYPIKLMLIGLVNRFHALAIIQIVHGTMSFKGTYAQIITSKQKAYGSIIIAGIYAYKNKEKRFPKTLDELEKWLGFELHKDQFTNKPLNYIQQPLKLYSSGKDMIKDTKDDIVLLPINFN